MTHTSKSQTSSIILSHRKLTPTSHLDTFYNFVAERHRAFKRRVAGGPPPWSTDKGVAGRKFCNVFRIYDRVTQVLLHEVIEAGPQEHAEVCFRVILFRLFNRPDTWKLLNKELGPLSWKTFNIQDYTDVLSERESLYTGAYILPPPMKLGRPRGFENSLRLVQLMMELNLPGELAKCGSMREAVDLVKAFPSMGDFLAYQLVLDLNMTPHLSFTENEFAVCGPGSKSCLESIFGDHVRGIEEDAVRWLVATQREHWARLGITDPPSMYEEGGLSMVDVEHALCECAKYIRESSGRSKALWKPNTRPITWDLPKKWVGAVPPPLPVIVSGDMMDEGEYEVSHIISRRAADGKYRVRWIGWGPEWDDWLSLTELDCASQCVKAWTRCQAWQKRVEEGVQKAANET